MPHPAPSERRPPRRLAAGLLAAVAGLLGASEAAAEFILCNRTAEPVTAAFAYPEDRQWMSQGWWNLQPGECRSLYPGKLVFKTYYLYAETFDGTSRWDGDYAFCTVTNPFRIRGDRDCEARGYETTGFFAAEVGEALDFTLDLVD